MSIPSSTSSKASFSAPVAFCILFKSEAYFSADVEATLLARVIPSIRRTYFCSGSSLSIAVSMIKDKAPCIPPAAFTKSSPVVICTFNSLPKASNNFVNLALGFNNDAEALLNFVDASEASPNTPVKDE